MIKRRSFLSAAGALAGRQVLRARPASGSSPDRDVHFISDGVQLSPRDYAQLLGRITEEKRVLPDTYSREGIVTELEQRMALLLGKECAVFLPTGTLANH